MALVQKMLAAYRTSATRRGAIMADHVLLACLLTIAWVAVLVSYAPRVSAKFLEVSNAL